MVPQTMEPFLNHFCLLFKFTEHIWIRFFRFCLHFSDESQVLGGVYVHLSNTWPSTLSLLFIMSSVNLSKVCLSRVGYSTKLLFTMCIIDYHLETKIMDLRLTLNYVVGV